MKGKRIFVFVLLALCICFLPARNTEAAVIYRNQFVKAQNGNISYFNSKGVKAKGIITVKGRKYYMDQEESCVLDGVRSDRNIISSDR